MEDTVVSMQRRTRLASAVWMGSRCKGWVSEREACRASGKFMMYELRRQERRVHPWYFGGGHGGGGNIED